MMEKGSKREVRKGNQREIKENLYSGKRGNALCAEILVANFEDDTATTGENGADSKGYCIGKAWNKSRLRGLTEAATGTVSGELLL